MAAEKTERMANQRRGQVTVRVQYFELIQRVVRVPGEQVVLPAGARVDELFAALAARHGVQLTRALLSADGLPLPNAVIMIDGSNIMHHQGMHTPLRHDCQLRVLLLPPFIGGG